jgi:hypothetical protein
MDNANKKKNPCMLIEKKINHKMLYTMWVHSCNIIEEQL